MTGYAIYSTINLRIRIRSFWLYFSSLLDCLQRRRIKYTFSEICSHGSRYEYTCLGNYLPDSTASDPQKTAVFRYRHIYRLRWRRLHTFMRHETKYAFISCCGLIYRQWRTAGGATLSGTLPPHPPPPHHKKKIAVLPNKSKAEKNCGHRTQKWETSTDFNALRCYHRTSSVGKSPDSLQTHRDSNRIPPAAFLIGRRLTIFHFFNVYHIISKKPMYLSQFPWHNDEMWISSLNKVVQAIIKCVALSNTSRNVWQ